MEMDQVTPSQIEYRITADDLVDQVGEGWVEFARLNGSDTLTSEAVLGRSLWTFIGGVETRELYRHIVRRARETGRQLRLPFRCDAPGCRRWLELIITPEPDGRVGFVSRTLREETREHVKILDRAREAGLELLRMCSVCKKVEVEDVWMEVEDAIMKLGLTEQAKPPGLTHGFCPSCGESYAREARLELEDMRAKGLIPRKRE